MSFPQQAAAAYRASQALDSRPAAVLAAAHQQLAASFDAALSAYQARALDRMCRHNELSGRILMALIAAVEGRSAEADELAGRYRRLQMALNRMLFDPQEIETIRSGHNWLCDMSRSFRLHLQ
jgi:hypothetical protein